MASPDHTKTLDDGKKIDVHSIGGSGGSPVDAANEHPPPYSVACAEGHIEPNDEADWQLDDAVEEEGGQNSDQEPAQHSSTFDPGSVPSSKKGRQHHVDKIVQAFLAKHSPPIPGSPISAGQLPCPVVIPQRRPHDKKRGFVRAYAPVLQPCGIDQESFLAFLQALHQSSKAHPIFDVINIVSLIAGVTPDITATIASTIVSASALAAIEMQGNMRTNDFLAQLNKAYFRPRGLFCLIFKYKPDANAARETVDLSSTIPKSIIPSSSRFKTFVTKVGRASGTYGRLEMPRAAPLVFPALDELPSSDAPRTKKESMKRKSKFVADYLDKRAQVAFSMENPDLVLTENAQQHKFASQHADPKHPMNSGSPISLLTGGTINPKAQQQRQGGPTKLVESLASKFRWNHPVLDEKLQENFLEESNHKSDVQHSEHSHASSDNVEPICRSADCKEHVEDRSVFQHPRRGEFDDRDVTGSRTGEDKNPDLRDPCPTKGNRIDEDHILKYRGSGGRISRMLTPVSATASLRFQHIGEIGLC